jgi:hypothetical protein
MVSRNNLIINTENTIAISFHTTQIRLPSRTQVVLKNMDITYKQN